MSEPGCFVTTNSTAGEPSIAESPRLIWAPSTMRATCPSSTGRSRSAFTTTDSRSLRFSTRPMGPNEEFVVADVEVAAGGVVVGPGQRGLDVLQRDAVLHERFGVHEDLELEAAAPHRHHLGDAGEREQAPSDDPIGDRANLGRRRLPRFAEHADDHDLAHDRRDGSELRLHPFRHPVGGEGDLFGDDLAGGVDVGPPIELDVDDREPDVADAADGFEPVAPLRTDSSGKETSVSTSSGA